LRLIKSLWRALDVITKTEEEAMKKKILGLLIISVFLVPFIASSANAQPYCLYCGRSFSSGGYVPPDYYSRQNIGPVYGRGMMGGGYHGSGDIEYDPNMRHLRYMPRYERVEPMNQEDAKERVQEWVDATDNPNIKVGSVQEQGDHYIVSIVTKKEGSLVDEIKVYKYTGDMRFVRVKPQ
jgi:hypothetical protein